MKKIYTLIAFAAVAFTANAQNRGSVSTTNSVRPSTASTRILPLPASGVRAPGDTLMYMPLPGTFVNATDNAGFEIVTEDNDMLTPQTSVDMAFGSYYSTDSSVNGLGQPTKFNYYHPWETPAPAGTDSTFFWQATSWFDPLACCADNWLIFGPLTIPAGGATLIWYDRTTGWRDGYQVLASSAFSSPLSFADFDASVPFFTETDDASPSATWAIDTTWELKAVNIPASFNGSQITIAFHHNANDMENLYLDEITLVEGLVTGVAQNQTKDILVSQNMPNPFSSVSTINYELANNSSVVLSVFDVTGKKVAERLMGSQNAGKHSIDFNAGNLSAGVYYYSLKVGDATTATMKMVIMK